MKGKLIILPLTFLLLTLLVPSNTLAHPGNTVSDGCHYCRTNCDKWGEDWDERHCHGGGSTAPVINTAPVPTATPTSKPTATPIIVTYPTATPTPRVTSMPSPTPTPTIEPTATNKPTPTITPTPAPEVMSVSIENEDGGSDSPVVNAIAGAVLLAILATPFYVGYRTVKFFKGRRKT